MEKTLDVKPIKNLSKFDLIYEFLKLQIETCYIFGPIAIVKATLETQQSNDKKNNKNCVVFMYYKLIFNLKYGIATKKLAKTYELL